LKTGGVFSGAGRACGPYRSLRQRLQVKRLRLRIWLEKSPRERGQTQEQGRDQIPKRSRSA
jgi:hypothetical protein